MRAADATERLRNLGLAVIAFGVVVAGLVVGRSLLIPLAIAILLWSLLEAMIQGFARVKVGPYQLPRWLATILGIAVVVFGFYLVASVLLGQVDAISAAWPRYAARLESMVSDLTQWLGPESAAKLKDAVAAIDIRSRIPYLIASTQSIVVSFLLVLAYIGFLFVERDHLGEKLVAMFPDARQAQKTSSLFATISQSVQHYLRIKTVVSVATAVLCYAVLRWLGIDFAETWALLIFVLNYIPNIGSILAVAFPALVALVQFETPGSLHHSGAKPDRHTARDRQRVGTHVDGKYPEHEPPRDHSWPCLLGNDLGHRWHVSERSDHGHDHDRLRSRAELAMGGDTTVQGRTHRRVNTGWVSSK